MSELLNAGTWYSLIVITSVEWLQNEHPVIKMTRRMLIKMSSISMHKHRELSTSKKQLSILSQLLKRWKENVHWKQLKKIQLKMLSHSPRGYRITFSSCLRFPPTCSTICLNQLATSGGWWILPQRTTFNKKSRPELLCNVENFLCATSN